MHTIACPDRCALAGASSVRFRNACPLCRDNIPSNVCFRNWSKATRICSERKKKIPNRFGEPTAGIISCGRVKTTTTTTTTMTILLLLLLLLVIITIIVYDKPDRLLRNRARARVVSCFQIKRAQCGISHVSLRCRTKNGIGPTKTIFSFGMPFYSSFKFQTGQRSFNKSKINIFTCYLFFLFLLINLYVGESI